METVEPKPVTIKKKRRGRPRGTKSQFDSIQKKILSYKVDQIKANILSQYSGPSQMVKFYLELVYFGGARKESYNLARVTYDKDVPIESTASNARNVIVHNLLSIAYLQLLHEGIIQPSVAPSDFDDIDFNIKRFKKVDLRYYDNDDDVKTIISFYRRVILSKIIKTEITFENEYTAMNSELNRKAIGDAEALRKIIWKTISNPHKPCDSRLIKQYSELCGFIDQKNTNDTNINISFTDFDTVHPVKVESND